MDLNMNDKVKLGGTAAKDGFCIPTRMENFSEEANDVEWVGKPADVKGKKDIEHAS